MSDDTGSTNVDKVYNDQYEKDIDRNGVPSITVCCQSIEPNGRGAMAIVVGPAESGRSDGDGISLYGGAVIQVKTVSKEQLNQIKNTLKNREDAQKRALTGTPKEEQELATSEVEK